MVQSSTPVVYGRFQKGHTMFEEFFLGQHGWVWLTIPVSTLIMTLSWSVVDHLCREVGDGKVLRFAMFALMMLSAFLTTSILGAKFDSLAVPTLGPPLCFAVMALATAIPPSFGRGADADHDELAEIREL